MTTKSSRCLPVCIAISVWPLGLSLCSCTQPHAAAASAARIVDFVPGVRIDYRVPQVEVDSEVILRRGQLELFAYSKAPVPKEHESILLTNVPAESIYQALGLIGLTPGRPMWYDAGTETVHPATGDPVDVSVRYLSGGKSVEVPACAWMLDLHTRQPMKPVAWVFAGSRRASNGTFQANVEGTIVTVVDFDSAVLALPESHTSSDADLWLVANTEAIPPVGTKVILLLRPARGP